MDGPPINGNEVGTSTCLQGLMRAEGGDNSMKKRFEFGWSS